LQVHLSDPSLLGDLVEFLQRCGCVAHAKDSHAAFVALPDSLPENAAELELDAYLCVFETLHPGARAQRFSDADRPTGV
jgi:hypothetical protein